MTVGIVAKAEARDVAAGRLLAGDHVLIVTRSHHAAGVALGEFVDDYLLGFLAGGRIAPGGGYTRFTTSYHGELAVASATNIDDMRGRTYGVVLVAADVASDELLDVVIPCAATTTAPYVRIIV